MTNQPRMVPFVCDECTTRITPYRHHYLLKDGRVLCPTCVDSLDLYDDMQGLYEDRQALHYTLREKTQ